MLLLVSGASGVGKTTVRLAVAPRLGEEFETAELFTLGPIPPVPTVAWRQEQAEVAVRRAVELDADGRHLLFAGDPVPAGEVLAAPSADQVDIAVCLLDADKESQSARLAARHDPPELLPLHHGFAAWMRHHATDPTFVPEAVTNDAWPEMRWDRWVGRTDLADRWAMTCVDTSGRQVADIADDVEAWCRAAVRGEVPVFRRGWHLG
jgi:hypothetical protein